MYTHASMYRAGLASLLVASLTGAAWAHTVPYMTPMGITVIDVSKLMDVGAQQFLWRRLGDAEGRPLYTSNADKPGKSSCYGDCAREFPPYVAPAGAKADGDWTIVSRDDHVKQWAYQGKPLYRYSGTDPRGEPQGGRFQLKEDPAWHDPGSRVFSPKDGWRRAEYAPENTFQMPTSVEIRMLPVVGGVGLVSTSTHMTVYAVPVSHKLSRDWRALPAAALAVPVGKFSILTRKDDGTRQWAYEGEALYTYEGDNAVGEVNGVTAGDDVVHAALVYRDFRPAGLTLKQYPGVGPLMTTDKGQTLYTVARFHHSYGGLESLGGYVISYNELKSQGTVGCEGNCTETWKPVLADSKAQSSGLWEVVTRENGDKQWAFKGSPVYTYIGDKKPGDIEGNARHVIAYGAKDGGLDYADAGGDPRSPKLQLGKLTMAVAVGASPGEKPTYIAGPGYVPSSDDPDGNADSSAFADKAVKKKTAAAAGGPVNDGGGGGDRFNRSGSDHGAGFYWHVVQPY